MDKSLSGSFKSKAWASPKTRSTFGMEALLVDFFPRLTLTLLFGAVALGNILAAVLLRNLTLAGAFVPLKTARSWLSENVLG